MNSECVVKTATMNIDPNNFFIIFALTILLIISMTTNSSAYGGDGYLTESEFHEIHEYDDIFIPAEKPFYGNACVEFNEYGDCLEFREGGILYYFKLFFQYLIIPVIGSIIAFVFGNEALTIFFALSIIGFAIIIFIKVREAI